MKTIVLACLGLLFCFNPAPAIAQKEYPLKVSIHEAVTRTLDEKEITRILERASDLLTRRNSCDVRFRLDTFGKFSSAPDVINDESDLEKVHSVDAHVKIVRQINYCLGRKGTFIGCAWRPDKRPKTMIVVRRVARDLRHILWTHEFGHTMGLLHRADVGALMTPCPLYFNNVKITPDECYCFRNGAEACPREGPNPVCTERRRSRWIAD